ncbi:MULTISPECIES: hypothetical protein [Brucella]|uniref:Putative lipoprotein n=1 Tax=Brucella lupini TaxID=255457 RepID=A0A256GWC8_9HYPH|nr:MULTISPECIES: hypothetical protein [Brucella]RNL43554.1 hypothetical protein D7I41_14555 [Ochrobactrum sp. MH181795]KAB2703945.1 hypothetical protein F9L03_11385 [Brucella lupini]KAB2728845.1 hypothetical protein F9K76_05315 [Brucella anthropi]KAB2746017.1 hypothetical protein F9K74_05265 [Brucella anthropi]KAB2752180.1 hypothetical protein F9L05_03420 [Brucella anthropi]
MKPNMNKARLSTMLLLAGVLTSVLAACNSTESALNVQGSNQNSGQNSGQTTTPAATPGTPATGTAPVQPTGTTPATTGTAPATTTPVAPQRSAALKPGKLHIAPIVGAPVNVVTPLTHRMNDDAKTKGIELAGNNDPSAAYVMKGYFSVLSEDNQTTVLYVWDVLDASGNRLHRIQGQEKVPGAAADSWSVVPASAMQTIADRTMQEYSTWLAANRA